MFPHGSRIEEASPCFPRIRGDVPFDYRVDYEERQFSPHTRGCSSDDELSVTVPAVFPAYAGMFRTIPQIQLHEQRFPRIRGDVPFRKNFRLLRK